MNIMNFTYIDLAPTSGMPPYASLDRDPAGKLVAEPTGWSSSRQLDRFFESFQQTQRDWPRGSPPVLAWIMSPKVRKSDPKCWMVGSLNIEDPHPQLEEETRK